MKITVSRCPTNMTLFIHNSLQVKFEGSVISYKVNGKMQVDVKLPGALHVGPYKHGQTWSCGQTHNNTFRTFIHTLNFQYTHVADWGRGKPVTFGQHLYH